MNEFYLVKDNLCDQFNLALQSILGKNMFTCVAHLSISLSDKSNCDTCSRSEFYIAHNYFNKIYLQSKLNAKNICNILLFTFAC